jgi:hypothetical protein
VAGCLLESWNVRSLAFAGTLLLTLLFGPLSSEPITIAAHPIDEFQTRHAAPVLRGKSADDPRAVLTSDTRLAFIQAAQVWSRVDTPHLDLRTGPPGPGAFQPDEVVACDYVDATMHGASRKFKCAITPDDVVKVRYGRHNGEVQGSLMATRLLWALGFRADRVYAVRVRCRGCSSDPWHQHGRASGSHDFDPAVIERPPPGHEMRIDGKKSGWAWPELDLVEETAGGAPRYQRDALKLLAVLMQHTDNKSSQQRLLCLPGGLTADGRCEKPFMMLHDVGLTFGHANRWNHDSTGSVNFQEWVDTPIWKDGSSCVGDLSKSHTGTLGDPRITEAGRKFLADLLLQLSNRQLHDLFEAAGVERRTTKSGGVKSQPNVEDWVAAFMHKRNEIVTHRCRS